MNEIVDFLFSGADSPPRGACLAWEPGPVWLRAVADTISALAYLSIPVAILTFLRLRRDLEPSTRRLAYLFIAFLLAGSLTHLASVVTLWVPAHDPQGLIKAATAAVSLATAVAVWPQVPRLLALPSPRDLRRSNARLAELNAALEFTIAWRTHELEVAQRRFEVALSRSNITVFTQDRDLRYTWIHNPAGELKPEDVVGRTTQEVYPEEAASELTEMRLKALHEGETVTDTVAVRFPSDGVVYLDMTVSPTRDQSGAIDGIISTTVDVTEKRLFEVRLAAMAAQLANAYRRFELALEDSTITVFEQDVDLRYTVMHNPPPGTNESDFLGKSDDELFSGAERNVLLPAKQKAIEQRARERLEVEVTMAGTPRYYDLLLEPRLRADGSVEGLVGTAVDLTERRHAERQMRLVMRELTHRSKNLLAVVQAMARKTASLSDDIDGFLTSFSARLGAMAAAHDLLVSKLWSGAGIGELVHATIAQTIDPESPQVSARGPALKLMPDTAQNLALAFHELTTNAVKHGALSVDTGQIDIAWWANGGDVHVKWRERGGPEVQRPEHRGFGRVLLERLVGATVGGSVTLDFAEQGIECTIVFPAERLADG